jgi:hypothetical protein
MARGHGRRGTPHGSRVRVSASGELEIDTKRLVSHLKARIPGMVQRRTQAGIDERGKPFKPYSSGYQVARLKSGRSAQPSLWLTGGMVSSYGLRSARLVGTTITLIFGPGASTSASLALGDKGSVMTGRRSPPHNLLGYYHQTGAGNLPRRRWMGLSDAEMATLAKEVEQLKGVWRLMR